MKGPLGVVFFKAIAPARVGAIAEKIEVNVKIFSILMGKHQGKD